MRDWLKLPLGLDVQWISHFARRISPFPDGGSIGCPGRSLGRLPLSQQRPCGKDSAPAHQYLSEPGHRSCSSSAHRPDKDQRLTGLPDWKTVRAEWFWIKLRDIRS